MDEAVRTAQQHGQEAMLTIFGTPRWAGGGKPNRVPRRLRDLRLFAQAIAARYSGRFEGFPFVRFWSVWNEPNLNLFLTPQFDRQGRSVAPRNYARLYASAYAGIKAGNRLAQVAIGETSARGRDRRRPGVSDTHSPGKFAELVAKANPRLRFAAWAHHPYPLHHDSKPSQAVRWPNVTLASLPRFREEPQHVVQEGVEQGLGHGVRPPDATGGRIRHLVRATGAIRSAVDRHRAEDAVRRDVHLVRLPGRPGAAVGLGPLHARGRPEGARAECLPRGRHGARSA